MNLRVEAVTTDEVPPDVVAIGLATTSSSKGPEVVPHGGPVDHEVARVAVPDRLDQQWCLDRGFTGRLGQTLVLSGAPGRPSLVLVGLGEAVDDAEAWRRAGAALARTGGARGTLAMVVPGDATVAQLAVGPLTEGASLATYRYDEFRSSSDDRHLDRLLLAATGPSRQQLGALAAAVARASAGAEAASWARDLINRPPSALTPAVLADLTVQRFAGIGAVEVEVWEKERIEAERLGGLLGVSRGSNQPPRFVRVTYQPPAAAQAPPHAVLVGKGITFDSGGLSLKTADGMTTMKTDMSGAAAVLATCWAAARENLGVRLTALTPITENMPGGSATKPGDVLTIRDGTTIEVLNTDAEGRLVLADALCLAVEERPDFIVDLATLTGAAVVALGSSIAASYSTDRALQEGLTEAGKRAGEGLWELPLVDAYREHIESEVADIKNIGRPGQAGSIVAALLLRHFVKEVPWAHLDIAGPARSAEAQGYLTKGGTGFGVRTLLEWLRALADGGAS